jgi:hypothetical protein
MTESDLQRRRTIETLIDLATNSDPGGCWDDARAEDLLRSQSTPAEARAAGMDEAMIQRIWTE